MSAFVAMRDGRPLSQRLAARGLDSLTLLVVPAVLFVLALFIYPFVYGFWLSLQPKTGPALANYTRFFSDSFLYGTIATTLWLALPVTLLNLALAVPIAFRVRSMKRASASSPPSWSCRSPSAPCWWRRGCSTISARRAG